MNVLWFRQMQWGTIGRKTNVLLRKATVFHSKDLSSYYLLNAPAHFHQISRIVKNESIDAILFANILAGSAAVRAGSRRFTPTVCDYLDHYPESARAYYENRAAGQAVARGVSKVIGWNVRNSTMNVAISDTFKQVLIGEYGVSPERVAIIPNGVNTDIFLPMEREDALQKLGLARFKDFLCVCYAGAVERWCGLETVAEVVERLSREGLKIALFVVGGGLGTGYYLDLRSKFGDRDNFLFTGFVSEDKVPLYICAAHLCVLSSTVSKISAGVPMKLLEYLACKRPVLSTPIPEVRQAVGDVVTVYDDAHALSEILKEIYRVGTNSSPRLDRGYNFALSRSWARISEAYEDLLEHVINSVRRSK